MKLNRLFKVTLNSFIKLLVIILITLILTALSTILFPKLTIITVNLGSFIVSMYLGIKFLEFSSWFTYKLDLRNYRKNQSYKKNISLFQWASNSDIDNNYVYSLLQNNASSDPLENMKKIKTSLKEILGKDIMNYYLFRCYLNVHGNNSVMDRFHTIFISVIGAAFTAFCARFLSVESIDKLSIFFSYNYNKSHNFIEVFPSILSIIQVMFFFLLIILYILIHSSSNSRRLKLLKEVINTLIDEKEK